ncbi:MAG: hypothetical protein JXQ65_16000 [Candidatus Marinimicrobia bacterium]|nr:hypothetical protein [Candidatus Neomarinimicrobiota bacterium]
MTKVLSLYSGGLDSRLIVKILKKKGLDVTAIHYQLPFISEKEINDDFLKDEQVDLVIIDCKKGDYLREYLAMLKQPKYGTGTGMNPCIDCKIFMFEKAKQYAVDYGYGSIATGEVPGQRPMSQLKHAQGLIDKNVDFPIIRPLAELGINGRGRDRQMELVKKYGGFHFPTPAGGCLLCEKTMAKRFQKYLEYDLIDEKTIALMKVGRHFLDEESGQWAIVARNGDESEILEKYDNCLESAPQTPAVWYSTINKGPDRFLRQFAQELQSAYITGQDKSLREKFADLKL